MDTGFCCCCCLRRIQDAVFTERSRGREIILLLPLEVGRGLWMDGIFLFSSLASLLHCFQHCSLNLYCDLVDDVDVMEFDYLVMDWVMVDIQIRN